MNRLLKSMLITCITIGFSVNNLSAQEAWEELAEQLIDEEGGEVFQWENNFEELSELRENPININTATKEELMTLKGIGESRAEDIIRFREDSGKFRKIEDIMKVPGIKNTAFQKIKENITV